MGLPAPDTPRQWGDRGWFFVWRGFEPGVSESGATVEERRDKCERALAGVGRVTPRTTKAGIRPAEAEIPMGLPTARLLTEARFCR